MPQRAEDSRDDFPTRRPAASRITGVHVVLAGVAAGLVAAIVGGGIWWAGRERKLPEIEFDRNSEVNKAFLKATRKAREERDNEPYVEPERGGR